MKSKIYAAVALSVMAMAISGCKKEATPLPDDVNVTVATTQAATEAATKESVSLEDDKPVLSKEGMLRSVLTGEWVDEKVAKRTPLAIMINNIEDADPQSGIDRAEIMYEAYVESDITRLMMILQDYDNMDKIGPVRSCREFYVYFAKEVGAIYIHFGFSPLAANLLASSDVQALDGMKGWCNFYRTTDRVAPHNAYTTTEGILDSIKTKGWDTELPDNYEPQFTFTDYDVKQIELTDGVDCTVFKPGFKRNKPVFTYNAEDGLYYREQYGRPHCDMESKTQLAFKNILVKFVSGTKFENGTPILDLVGSGSAYYITNGKLVKCQWKKESDFAPTKYYYENGEEIVFNQGKTFINVITMDNAEDVSYQ